MITSSSERQQKRTDEQDEIVVYTGGPLLISASAGTGKTYVLVERILQRIVEGANIDQFLIITFTRNAAAELRSRISRELNARIQTDPNNQHLLAQNQRLHMAHICTIDSFCQDLLRQHAQFLNISSDFQVCYEGSPEEQKIINQVLNELLEAYFSEINQNGYNSNKSRTALTEFAFDKWNGNRIVEMISMIHKKIKDLTDPKRWLQMQRQKLPNMTEEQKDLAKVSVPLLELVMDYEDRLLTEKIRQGVLTFSDVTRLTVQLLTSEADKSNTNKELRDTIRSQFQEILVDEYQDTNELQDSLFTALSDNGTNLVYVGDIKQSIYRFRDADPSIFKEKNNAWSIPADEKKGTVLYLRQNFRSRPQILSAVNDVFTQIMSEECGEMPYGDESKLTWDDTALIDEKYNVELDVLDIPEEENASLLEARYVANRLKKLAEDSQLHVNGVPFKYSDAVILLRSTTHMQSYVDALNELNIPVDQESNVQIFNTTEVKTVIAFLKIIDNPHRDIPLISVLFSPLFHFSTERLAQIRSHFQKNNFYDAILNDNGDDCKNFVKLVELLQYQSKKMSGYSLVKLLYRYTNLMSVFGSKGNNNLRALLDQVRELDRAGYKTLSALLQQLDLLSQKNSVSTTLQNTDGIKIMTIHKAKGLEFPVVFLCGLASCFNTIDENDFLYVHKELGIAPKYYIKEKKYTIEKESETRRDFRKTMKQERIAEEMRLLYVAMTRPKEKLIMTIGFQESKRKAGCKDQLKILIKNLSECANGQLPPELVAGKDSMGIWLLLASLSRPEASPLREYSGKEGADRVVRPEHRGFDWDIRILNQEKMNLYQSPPNEESNQSSDDDSNASQTVNPSVIQYSYAQLTQLPSTLAPTKLNGLNNSTQTGNKNQNFGKKNSRFQLPNWKQEETKLTGMQKGTAVHKVMQYICLDKVGSKEKIAIEIQRLVEENFITQQEADCISADQIFTFFSSDLGKQLLAADNPQREYEFSLLIPVGKYFRIKAKKYQEEQMLFQGVIDCWFEDKNGITIIDYKTDLKPAPDQYEAQVKSYAYVLETLLNKSVYQKALFFLESGESYYFH